VVDALDGHHLRHAAGAVIPRLVKIFTSTKSKHVAEVVDLVPARAGASD